MEFSLAQQLANIKTNPGIYKFLDTSGTILYVGKANNLKSRVSSYFNSSHEDRPHIISMIPRIVSVETITTENEVDALVLESALIKRYKPHYNVMLKDDKSYAWLLITDGELPSVEIIRSVDLDNRSKGTLYGPYPNGRAVRQVFKYIRTMYPFCTHKNPKEPCLYYHLGMCGNPAFGEDTRKEYMKNIRSIRNFLNGRQQTHINDLRRRMKKHSKEKRFEDAAKLRDKINDLEYLGKDNLDFQSEEEFAKSQKRRISKYISEMISKTSADSFDRVECYDISTLQGENSYGSMVVSVDGEMVSKDYRIFKIKNDGKPNDFEMLQEVLKRRIKHIGNNPKDSSLDALPDVILIDGGKGQLSSVASIIPEEIALLGISKGRHMRRKGQRKRDQFWDWNSGEVRQFFLKNPQILVTLRDEAHRFAIKHNRQSRKFYKKGSVLDKVEGLGPKRKKLLIKTFGSVAKLKELSYEELNSVLNNRTVTVNLMEVLRGKER